MTPPPEPTVPAIRPAPTAPIINWTSNLGVQCKSPSTNWYPCSTLRWCSLLIRKMLDAVMQTINKINSIIRTKSKAEQDSIPITESMFEFPRNRLIEMRTKKREGIITRLAGFRWVFSLEIIFCKTGWRSSSDFSSETLFSLLSESKDFSRSADFSWSSDFLSSCSPSELSSLLMFPSLIYSFLMSLSSTVFWLLWTLPLLDSLESSSSSLICPLSEAKIS